MSPSKAARRPERLSNPVLGVLLVVLTSVALVLAFTKDLPFGGTYEIRGVFADGATEVKSGSPVRIAGVNVGKVSGVERGPGTTRIVTMEVTDAGRPLNEGTTLAIRPRLFLEGNFFVEARPGPPGQPELEDGGTIGLSQTAQAVQTDEVLSALDRDTRRDLQGLLREAGAAFANGGGRSINRSFEFWDGAFTNTAVVARALRGTERRDLSGFVRNAATISRALAARDGDLAGLVTNLARTTQALASESDALRATVRGLDTTFGTARPGLVELDRALPAVERFAENARPALAAAPAALDDAQVLLRGLRGLVSAPELPALLGPLSPALRDTAALVPRATALLDQLAPVTSCINERITPILNARLEDGRFTTGDRVYEELARFPVGLAGASGNFDANGYGIRYHAGGGENLITTSAPGTGDLLSMTERPVIGARPRWVPGEQPPFRPDAACADQPLTDLRAETAPASLVQQRRITAAERRRGTVARTMTRAIERLERLARRAAR